METYYNLGGRYSPGALEIKPNRPFAEMDDLLCCFGKERIADDVVFEIKHNSKAMDIIYYYECISKRFHSEKLIKILSEFMDMSDKCYQINIKGLDSKYYFINNLPIVSQFWEAHKTFDMFSSYREPFILYQDNVPPIFIIQDTNIIAVNKDVKNALEEGKLTNVKLSEYEGIFRFSLEEYEAYQKYWKEIGQYIYRGELLSFYRNNTNS